ncbi:MAG: S1 family peptidase [Flavitalea sp.]
MRFTKALIFFSVILLLFPSFSHPPVSIKEEVAKSIVRVRSGNKISTGFFWKNGASVMTTLHSIGNINSIELFIPKINAWKKATIQKVFKSADLILLKVNGYVSDQFLSQRYTASPPVDTKAFTIGYYSGSVAYIDRDFDVGLLQGSTLNDLLPPASRQFLADLGFPSLSTRIVYLKGNLLHGFSGAPIVDLNGKLIGIADGGLENGAAGISWCVNSIHIPTLENSTEGIPNLNNAKINVLFASEEYQPGTDNVSFELNGQRFKKVKTRSFEQLDLTGNYSSMDAVGLNQLLNLFRPFNYPSFTYDVYLEEQSGATFVVPAGSNISKINGMLTASTGKIRYYMQVVQTNNIQAASVQFELAIMPYYYTNWSADAGWTYLYPYPGPNNSSVRRRAYFGNAGRHYLFEALAGNPQYFLGVAVIRDNVIVNPNSIEDNTEWAKAALAVQLTTFSN